MTRDREVNLGNLNDVTVDDHGDAGRRPSSAGGNKSSDKGAKPPKAPQKPAPASHGGGGGWMIACLVLVVLIAVMGVWFQKQMTVLQSQMDERISESSQKLGNLQSRLSATDESLNQSSGQLQDTVRAQGKKPEEEFLMMISDIEMPEMDGYTLTAEIRSDPRMQKLHIVLHTSLSGVFNQAMVKKVGADDFLAKFRPDDLASRVVDRIKAADHG